MAGTISKGKYFAYTALCVEAWFSSKTTSTHKQKFNTLKWKKKKKTLSEKLLSEMEGPVPKPAEVNEKIYWLLWAFGAHFSCTTSECRAYTPRPTAMTY